MLLFQACIAKSLYICVQEAYVDVRLEASLMVICYAFIATQT